MTTIVKLLKFEEGYRDKPYVDTEGFPTVGYGFLLGPKIPGTKTTRANECKRLYTFMLPQAVGDVWLLDNVSRVYGDMLRYPRISSAIISCSKDNPRNIMDNPRVAVLISMAYQMGVEGLNEFVNTLRHISNMDWFQAETGMLKSKWATQTPLRARRHAMQMRTGVWRPEYQ